MSLEEGFGVGFRGVVGGGFPRQVNAQKRLNIHKCYDPSCHLQECSGARAGAVPPGVLFEFFGQPGSECPKVCFLSVFWRVFGAKKHQKTLKKHSLGHSEPGAQKHSKSTPGGTAPARALEHSCKWRLGSQHKCLFSNLISRKNCKKICFLELLSRKIHTTRL